MLIKPPIAPLFVAALAAMPAKSRIMPIIQTAMMMMMKLSSGPQPLPTLWTIFDFSGGIV